jgi:hypothetical protein
MRREKDEVVVRLCHGILHKIRDNVDRIKESDKSGTKGFFA